MRQFSAQRDAVEERPRRRSRPTGFKIRRPRRFDAAIVGRSLWSRRPIPENKGPRRPLPRSRIHL